MSWKEFRRFSPPFSIAIDGFVCEGPKFDSVGPRANFNHHEGVSRLETRATAAQVLMAIRMGLTHTFQLNGRVNMTVFANDCDEDVCLSWYLLSHSVESESTTNRLLNRLVSVSDFMDTTAGLYPISHLSDAAQEVAWIFYPYRRFRMEGGLEGRNSGDFHSIVEAVCGRISAHLSGRGEKLPLDVRYERIGGGNSWAMIREIGPFGRQAAFHDGVRAFVSVRERKDGLFAYSIGRASEFIPFPVSSLLAELTAAERLKDPHHLNGDSWGGATTIGGSPRSVGSMLSPKEVEAVINGFIAQRR